MPAKTLRLCLALLCAMLGACGQAARPVLNGANEQAAGFKALPAPGALLGFATHSPATTDTPLFKTGDAFDPALPHNLCAAQPNEGLLFMPAFLPGAGPGGLAFAIYRFNVEGYGGALDFSAGWATGPFQDNAVYFGIGNFEEHRWDWFMAADGSGPAVPDKAAHSADDGSVLVAIVITGSSSLQLSSLALGNAVPLVELVTPSATEGPPGLTVELDGSTSSDPDGSIVDYAWDPEGDGSYLPHLGPGSPLFNFTFCATGTYHPTLRVTDDQGASATASLTVSIKLGSPVEVTIGNIGGGDVYGVCLREVNGKPAVAYNSGTGLFFARATNSDGNTWVVPVEMEAQMGYSGFDLEVVSGRPALAFQTLDTSLACFQASDSDGAVWPPFHTAVPTDDALPGFYPSLAEGNNLPMIVYGDGYGDLWLVRATASDLSAWSVPKALSNPSDYCAVPSLGWVGGLPAFSCATVIGLSEVGRMQYARAEAAWDVSWQAPLAPLAAGSHVLNGNSLIDVGGKPAIVYKDDALSQLTCLRAVDTDGLDWETPQDLPAAVPVADFGFSSALVNGLPCVAYAAEPGSAAGGLWIVYAANTLATAWGDPILLKANVFSNYLALADINGRPGVAWLEDASGNVRYKSYVP